jgi:hypothetical protein
MSWSDTADIQNQLDAALDTYQWGAAASTCEHLIRRISEESSPCPDRDARAILASLRRKRQFALVGRVAEAFIRSGQNAPPIRRHYAQSLIDQGVLFAPEFVLQALTMEPLDDDSEVAEAHGLLGRIYKQLYVNAGAPSSPYARMFFERALSEYLQTYRRDPQRYVWHGINVVALLHRGRADGIDVTHAPGVDDLARQVLQSLPEPSRVMDIFELATRLEALVALGNEKDAADAALEYVRHPGADAFEIGSTLRQFEEVWRLHPDSSPGATILPILRAAKLRCAGGQFESSPAQVDDELRRVRQAASTLEKIFGDDRTVTLHWYETGLQRTRSVARIERRSGKGHGTGWLVRAGDILPEGCPAAGPSSLVLLTNAHVINRDGSAGALAPDDAKANFQRLGKCFDFAADVIWSSPPDQLDATLVALKGEPPDAPPIPVLDKKVRFTEPPSRLYIIGHAGGRDLQFSLHDNLLLGCNDRLLHYRTPTEQGSSGSPVFEAEDWRAVALHHAGGTFERLDGRQPPYEANEGITIRAIRTQVAADMAAKRD